MIEQDAPPFGEQPLDAPANAEPHVDWEKRYNDLRPHADRTTTQLNDATKRSQELETELAVLKREREVEILRTHAKPASDPYDEETWYSDDNKRVFNDFPEVFEAGDRRYERMVNRAISDAQGKIEERIKSEVDSRVGKVQSDFNKMRRQSYFDNAIGANVWPEIEENADFVNWVNQDEERVLKMTEGSDPMKVNVFRDFIAVMGSAQGGEQVERRQQVSSVMGTSPPSVRQTGGQQLSGQQLWNQMAQEESSNPKQQLQSF